MRGLQPYVLALWMAGVLSLGLGLLAGLVGVRILLCGRQPLPIGLAGRVAAIARRLGCRGLPSACSSPRVREATLVRLLRPVVLVPAAWLAEVTPEMLEAVIAHELVHLRRLDAWVNLLQRLIETLLFYHPAVWLVSRRIRRERELCCDELAVTATGRRVDYLRALEHVARQRKAPASPQWGMAMGGNTMVLLDRVRNLTGLGPQRAAGR